jgi:hypothetical protein
MSFKRRFLADPPGRGGRTALSKWIVFERRKKFLVCLLSSCNDCWGAIQLEKDRNDGENKRLR